MDDESDEDDHCSKETRCRISGYLKQFIANATPPELKELMKFWTGWENLPSSLSFHCTMAYSQWSNIRRRARIREKMYLVICFDKDEEVEVAPTSWFQEGTCRWPRYKSQGVQRAIKQLEEAQSTWPVHTDARTFYSSDSIIECRKRVSLALEQTDYTSEADDQHMRPKRKLNSSSDDSGEEKEVEEEEPSSTPDFSVFIQVLPVGITGQPPD
ncbi:uncharacterized protein ACNS7B_021125 [Menidia menidia]